MPPELNCQANVTRGRRGYRDPAIGDACDPASNVIAQATRQRFDDAPDTDLGALADPAPAPKARAYYTATYPDAVGRLVAVANFGTNGGAELARPGLIPPCRELYLVSLSIHNARGELAISVDANGIKTVQTFDDAGRIVETLENVVEALRQ